MPSGFCLVTNSEGALHNGSQKAGGLAEFLGIPGNFSSRTVCIIQHRSGPSGPRYWVCILLLSVWATATKRSPVRKEPRGREMGSGRVEKQQRKKGDRAHRKQMCTGEARNWTKETLKCKSLSGNAEGSWARSLLGCDYERSLHFYFCQKNTHSEPCVERRWS